MPGMLPESEWAAYFDDLADAFGLTIERVGPYFGSEHLLDVLADSAKLAHLSGEQTRILWPDHYDLRRIPVRHPTSCTQLADLASRQHPPRSGTLLDTSPPTKSSDPRANLGPLLGAAVNATMITRVKDAQKAGSLLENRPLPW